MLQYGLSALPLHQVPEPESAAQSSASVDAGAPSESAATAEPTQNPHIWFSPYFHRAAARYDVLLGIVAGGMNRSAFGLPDISFTNAAFSPGSTGVTPYMLSPYGTPYQTSTGTPGMGTPFNAGRTPTTQTVRTPAATTE